MNEITVKNQYRSRARRDSSLSVPDAQQSAKRAEPDRAEKTTTSMADRRLRTCKQANLQIDATKASLDSLITVGTNRLLLSRMT